MASEYCLTCGHTKHSHVFVEKEHVLIDGEKVVIIARLGLVIVSNSEYSLKGYNIN
jgi:hypothetical protein